MRYDPAKSWLEEPDEVDGHKLKCLEGPGWKLAATVGEIPKSGCDLAVEMSA